MIIAKQQQQHPQYIYISSNNINKMNEHNKIHSHSNIPVYGCYGMEYTTALAKCVVFYNIIKHIIIKIITLISVTNIGNGEPIISFTIPHQPKIHSINFR